MPACCAEVSLVARAVCVEEQAGGMFFECLLVPVSSAICEMGLYQLPVFSSLAAVQVE